MKSLKNTWGYYKVVDQISTFYFLQVALGCGKNTKDSCNVDQRQLFKVGELTCTLLISKEKRKLNYCSKNL